MVPGGQNWSTQGSGDVTHLHMTYSHMCLYEHAYLCMSVTVDVVALGLAVICCCRGELAGNKVAVHHTALQGFCHECGDTSADMTTSGIGNSSVSVPLTALAKMS